MKKTKFHKSMILAMGTISVPIISYFTISAVNNNQESIDKNNGSVRFEGVAYNDYDSAIQDMILKNKLSINKKNVLMKNQDKYADFSRGIYNPNSILDYDLNKIKLAYLRNSTTSTMNYQDALNSLFNLGNIRATYSDGWGNDFDDQQEAVQSIKSHIFSSKIGAYEMPEYNYDSYNGRVILKPNRMPFNTLSVNNLGSVKRYIKNNINNIIIDNMKGLSNPDGYSIIFDDGNPNNTKPWTVKDYLGSSITDADDNYQLINKKLVDLRNSKDINILAKYEHGFNGNEGTVPVKKHQGDIGNRVVWDLSLHLENPLDNNANLNNIVFLTKPSLLSNNPYAKSIYSSWLNENPAYKKKIEDFKSSRIDIKDLKNIINYNHETFKNSVFYTNKQSGKYGKWGNSSAWSIGSRGNLVNKNSSFAGVDEQQLNLGLDDDKKRFYESISSNISNNFINSLMNNPLLNNEDIKKSLLKNGQLEKDMKKDVENLSDNLKYNFWLKDGIPIDFIQGRVWHHSSGWATNYSYWQTWSEYGKWETKWKINKQVNIDMDKQITSPYSRNFQKLLNYSNNSKGKNLKITIRNKNNDIFNGEIALDSNSKIVVKSLKINPKLSAKQIFDNKIEFIKNKLSINSELDMSTALEKIDEQIIFKIKSNKIISEQDIKEFLGVDKNEFYILLLELLKNKIRNIKSKNLVYQEYAGWIDKHKKIIVDISNNNDSSIEIGDSIKYFFITLISSMGSINSPRAQDLFPKIILDGINNLDNILVMKNNKMIKKFYVNDSLSLIEANLDSITGVENKIQKVKEYISNGNYYAHKIYHSYNSNGNEVYLNDYKGDSIDVIKYISKNRATPRINKNHIYYKINNIYELIDNTKYEVYEVTLKINNKDVKLFFNSYENSKKYILNYVKSKSF